MAHKHIKFLKRTFVQKLGYTFTGCIFATFMLLFDGFLATAETRLGAKLDEFFYFFKLAAHVMRYKWGLFLFGIFAQFHQRAYCGFGV